jgi:hypothetical protein
MLMASGDLRGQLLAAKTGWSLTMSVVAALVLGFVGPSVIFLFGAE